MRELESILQKVKASTYTLGKMTSKEKNEILNKVADNLLENEKEILLANEKDVQKAEENHVKESLIDRLRLDISRIEAMALGLRKVAALSDPVGEILEGKVLENGLQIMKKRVPLGVIAIIYESRPNVTTDAFGLCFKSGNATVLRGGSDAIRTNLALVQVIKDTLTKEGVDFNILYLVEDTSREVANQLMKMREYIDVLIPRGGRGLIQSVVQNSMIPVIETGTGNCHIYVDESADLEMAVAVTKNAKTQRTGVCNACESLVVHEKVSKKFIPMLVETLSKFSVQIRGDERACLIDSTIVPATEEDWDMEYLDLILSLKIVDDMDEAIGHINQHSTKHSESIITRDYQNAQRFLNEVDSSCVYVNSSTRFTDGEEFSLGAEIGISTQKLHARGPMGLKELTTTKYIIYGNGQIRK